MTIRWIGALLYLSLLTGCAPGLVFRKTTLPLTKNLHRAPVVTSAAGRTRTNVKHVRYRVDFMWDSNAIGDAAKRAGLRTVHYADLETLSVLGIWNQYFLHAYGE